MVFLTSTNVTCWKEILAIFLNFSLREYNFIMNNIKQKLLPQKLLSACVSTWTEAHKICKLEFLLTKSSHGVFALRVMVKQVKSSS